MKSGHICLVVAFVGLVAGCASSGTVAPRARSLEEGTRRPPRMEVSVFTGRRDLDAIEFDPDDSGFGPTADYAVDRERTGVRVAFGPETIRGFFEVFSEKLDGEFFDPTYGQFDALGASGGVTGLSRAHSDGSEVDFVLPYTAKLSVVAGREHEDFSGMNANSALVYLELHADVGIGLDWRGLRPSAGLQLSSLVGALAFDEDIGGDGDDDRVDLSGANFGPFVEVYYKHPQYPIFGRLRASGGDYDVTELTVGMAW